MRERSLMTAFSRRLMLSFLLVLVVTLARAGGPKYVAGTSYFASGVAGQPITWANGTVIYYTDQGNLGSMLSGPQADH